MQLEMQFFTPTVVTRQPDGSLVARAGKPVAVPNGDYVTTAEAGRILSLSPRRVQELCDQGPLVEGQDWWRVGDLGWYRIRRAAVLALRGVEVPTLL